MVKTTLLPLKINLSHGKFTSHHNAYTLIKKIKENEINNHRGLKNMQSWIVSLVCLLSRVAPFECRFGIFL